MAKIFGKILVPYDHSPHSKQALEKALGMAEITGANVTLVHVISKDNAPDKMVGPNEDSIFRQELDFLNPIEHEAMERNIALDEEILYGNTVEEIQNLMKNQNFDIVIMGRRGNSKSEASNLGSVSNALVQNSKIPILVAA
jgi:nucleotide-binding universal stress UspA family protein